MWETIKTAADPYWTAIGATGFLMLAFGLPWMLRDLLRRKVTK